MCINPNKLSRRRQQSMLGQKNVPPLRWGGLSTTDRAGGEAIVFPWLLVLHKKTSKTKNFVFCVHFSVLSCVTVAKWNWFPSLANCSHSWSFSISSNKVILFWQRACVYLSCYFSLPSILVRGHEQGGWDNPVILIGVGLTFWER